MAVPTTKRQAGLRDLTADPSARERLLEPAGSTEVQTVAPMEGQMAVPRPVMAPIAKQQERPTAPERVRAENGGGGWNRGAGPDRVMTLTVTPSDRLDRH